MDRKNETFLYHIRWLGGALDWEAWSKGAAAEYSVRSDCMNGPEKGLDHSVSLNPSKKRAAQRQSETGAEPLMHAFDLIRYFSQVLHNPLPPRCLSR